MVNVERVHMRNGVLDFSDQSLVLPFAALIQEFGGTITGLSTQPGTRAHLKLEGGVDEFGQAQVVVIDTDRGIADSAADASAARLLTREAAWLADSGTDAKVVHAKASMAKLFASETAEKVCSDAIQIHGGAGVSYDTVLPMLYAQARVLRLADGPDEVHRGMIAKVELAKYGSRLAKLKESQA